MRDMYACAMGSLALLMACAVQHPSKPSAEVEGEPNTDVEGEPSAPPSGSASCPLGTATYDTALGLSNPLQTLDLAIDTTGDSYFAASVGEFSSAPAISGVTELSASGTALRSLPVGTLVATDDANDLFVAGPFTQPIDLGGGPIIPQGSIDVFLAKFDMTGKLVFAKELGLCGDDVESLAVARDGRIALSGSAMGTVALSATGGPLFQLAVSGFIAFDSKGNLAIASSSSPVPPTSELTVTEVDVAGSTLFEQMFEGTGAAFTAIAIDSRDDVVVVGSTTGSVTFYGVTVTARYAGESGRFTGAFFVNIGNEAVTDLGMVEANAVAIDATGNSFVAGAFTGNTAFFRIVAIAMLDPHQVLSFVDLPEEMYGRAVAIAIDSCGSLIVGMIRQDTPSPLSPIHAVATKLAQ